MLLISKIMNFMVILTLHLDVGTDEIYSPHTRNDALVIYNSYTSHTRVLFSRTLRIVTYFEEYVTVGYSGINMGRM